VEHKYNAYLYSHSFSKEVMSSDTPQKKKVIHLHKRSIQKDFHHNLVGTAPPMQQVLRSLETIQDSDSHVLIIGETGTGKELIAEAIHNNTPQRQGPMISVNCGAIPRELMEREFFGHVKGAYTGAVETKNGYFTEAHGGTLFLDEIGEMDINMQVKLLRVLERGVIIRVGESTPQKVDVRLIAATNKDLRTEVQNGNFREDLFYRIYVIPIHVPPLRQRKEDIPLLIEHFLEKLQKKLNKNFDFPSEKEMRMFMDYSYPGNVRELEHIIERFYMFNRKAKDLFLDLKKQASTPATNFPYDELLCSQNPLKTVGQKARAQAEKDLIMHVLNICNNDYTKAARMLNIGLSSLYRKLKETE